VGRVVPSLAERLQNDLAEDSAPEQIVIEEATGLVREHQRLLRGRNHVGLDRGQRLSQTARKLDGANPARLRGAEGLPAGEAAGDSCGPCLQVHVGLEAIDAGRAWGEVVLLAPLNRNLDLTPQPVFGKPARNRSPLPLP
jgi:hypothetical protein